MAAERVGRTVARAAACSGMTGLRCSWRLVGWLFGRVAAADTAGREQLGAAVMKEWAVLDTVAALAGFALPDYMHHSHNPAHPTPLG